jgi:hypothetical protein
MSRHDSGRSVSVSGSLDFRIEGSKLLPINHNEVAQRKRPTPDTAREDIMHKRGRESRSRSDQLCQIPIVDAAMRIVGWTSQVPVIRAGDLRHPEAEALVGGPVQAVYVELTNPADAMVAGAPSDWREPWRCLALADQRAIPMPAQGSRATSIALSQRD